MIEHSTSVIASEAKEVNLFLLKGSATLEKIREVFISDTKVNIHEITYIDKFLFNLGLLNFSIKKILLNVDYILFHNIKLINVLQKFNKIKPLFFFFHTDKYKHIKKFRYIEHIFTVNTKTRNIVNTYFNSNKAKYLPNCINTDTIEVQKLVSSNRKKLVVGAMGRLIEKKGFDFLINAFKNLSNVDLIIGGAGPIKADLIKLSKKYSNIKLIGWVKDKDKFFSNIDVFCSSSTNEPFGLVILEAMARGIPVISTNCKGPSDIIKNYHNGILVNVNNIAELRHTVRQLEKNIDLRKKISKNGLKTIKYKYTREVYKKNLLSFLD